jgi:hypothetical protein
MTKKDYVKLAECVKENTLPGHGVDMLLRVPTFVRSLMSVLQKDNERFSRERFWVACGLKREEL